MPVSPKATDAYVSGSNRVDICVSQIDRILSSSDEKYYRHGTEDDDYFYTFAIAIGHLDPDEINIFRRVYTDAGWGSVQVRNFFDDELAIKMILIRIFRSKDSKFIQWETK